MHRARYANSRLRLFYAEAARHVEMIDAVEVAVLESGASIK